MRIKECFGLVVDIGKGKKKLINLKNPQKNQRKGVHNVVDKNSKP